MTITRIQVRHDIAENWTARNPKLLVGEFGVETDTGRFKIGNGAELWDNLAYVDDSFVHKSLDEIIEGTKQFNGSTIFNSVTANNISVSNLISGTISNSIKDQKDNIIDEYYQKDLKQGEVNGLTDWDTLMEEGVYKVQIPTSEFISPEMYHYPATYGNQAVYSFGLLIVSKSGVEHEGRTLQMYVPHQNSTILYRMYNQTSWTEWFSSSDRDNKIVHRDGDEVINGIKTFNVTPIFAQGVIDCKNDLKVIKEIDGSSKVILTNDSNNNTTINGLNETVEIRPTNNDEAKAVFTRVEKDNPEQLGTKIIGCRLDAWCTKDGIGNTISERYQPRLSLISKYLTDDKQTFDFVKALKRSTYDGDKFRITGAPTVSNVGIVSNLTGSVMSTIYNFNPTSNWTIKGTIITGEDVTTSQVYLSASADSDNTKRKLALTIENGGKFGWGISTDGASWSGGFKTTNYTAKANTMYYYQLSYNTKNRKYMFNIGLTEDSLSEDSDFTFEGLPLVNGEAPLRIGNEWNSISKPFLGSIDVKQLVVYYESNESFNSNKTGIDYVADGIEIPYYKTKTGAKVTDITYRESLDACWDYFGTGNYFNIDEENKLASLPYDTTYGECKVLETYRGTANGQPFTYEYNTNLECTETGICEEGIPVILPYPYADNTYYVSVPTSEKTPTSFTPTVSGDYLTKGRITFDNRKGYGNGGIN